MVMHINAAHDAAYLLSIPRDTLVTIPAFPKSGFGGSREKIDAAYESGSLNGAGREGGFELLATTIAQVTGLRFNAGAIVNFDGFEAVVNALGGVDMCIDETTTSFDHDVNGNELRDGNAPMVYEQGCRHLLPWQALDFVRQRHSLSSGDYGRQRHQQQFLKAVAKAAMNQGLTDPIKLDRVLTATGKALTVDPGRASLTDWIFTLKGLGADGLTLLNTNGGSFAAVECPDGSSCQMLTPDSEQMFAAAKNDTLPAFIQQHPTWVSNA
jgi:LCP family protein required for cell wall assembly